MNEKAIELYKQAAEFAYKNVDKEFWETSAFQGVVVGKFAELIVRECTNMLPTDSIRNEEGVHMFYVIRDHFGVSPYEGVR